MLGINNTRKNNETLNETRVGLHKFVVHMKANVKKQEDPTKSNNRFFSQSKSDDTSIVTPSEQYMNNFALLKESTLWESFLSKMVRLIPIAYDHINDLVILPTKIFLTEAQLNRYLLEKDQENYVYAYSEILDFIRTELWLTYLKPALEEYCKKFPPGSAEFKAVADQLLDKIIKTFCLNTCLDNSDFNQTLTDKSTLCYAHLPVELQAYFDTQQTLAYRNVFAKLLKLVTDARLLHHEAKKKYELEIEILIGQHADLSYHFTSQDETHAKFINYIERHYKMKSAHVSELDDLMSGYKVFDAIIEAIVAEALNRQGETFIPKLKTQPKKEGIYLNKRYLPSLFEMLARQFLIITENFCKVNKTELKSFTKIIAETMAKQWVDEVATNQLSCTSQGSLNAGVSHNTPIFKA